MTSEDDFFDTQPSVTGVVCSTACCCAPAVSHRSAVTLNCSECFNPTLVACLLNQFKLSGSYAQKYACSYEWIHAFIQHSGLRYTCQNCVKAAKSRGTTNNSSIEGNFQDEFNSVKHSLSEFDTKLVRISSNLSEFQNSINIKLRSLSDEVNKYLPNLSVNSNADLIMNTSADSLNQPVQSYVNAVSSNVKAAVKSAVVESLREQHHDRLVNESVVIYGMPEGKDDFSRVAKLLEDVNSEFIECVARIGKHSTSKLCKPRPIRVGLYDIQDKEWVLSNAHRLVKKLPTLKLRISKYLSASELSHLVKTRDECSRLNKASSGKLGDSDRYVVINDRIMQKTPDGKLQRYIATQSNSISGSAITNNPTKQSLSSSIAILSSSQCASSTAAINVAPICTVSLISMESKPISSTGISSSAFGQPSTCSQFVSKPEVIVPPSGLINNSKN